MCALDDGDVAQLRLEVARIASPEHRDERSAARREHLDRALGDGLPALTTVRTGGARLDGEHPVEQQYALGEPRAQVAVGWRRDAEVVAQLLVHVAQRGRQRRHVRAHRERQSHGVTWRGVRVLADHEHPYLLQRERERPQYVLPRREVRPPSSELTT